MPARVIASFNNESGDRCVDVFQRQDGTFGFEEFRRDHEDLRGWFSLQQFGTRAHAGESDAIEDAKTSIQWLGDKFEVHRGILHGRTTRSPDSMQTLVERAGEGDVPLLVDLMGRFYAESHHALDRRRAGESFGRLLRSESLGRAWIARREAEAVGYVVLTLRHSMEHGALAGFIDDLFVLPGARRKGVGSALLRTLFDACRQLEVSAVQVEVGSGNAAASGLYREFGLVPCTDGRLQLATRLPMAPNP